MKRHRSQLFIQIVIAFVALSLSGCSFIQFYPYEGVQKKWPTSEGSFADTGGKVPVYIGFPPRPYTLLGMVNSNFAADAPQWAKRNQWCHQAKKFGADAVVILTQEQAYAGTVGGGSAISSASATGNSFVNARSTVSPSFPTTINTTGSINSYATGQSVSSYNSWSAPTYREHTTAWLVKWK